VPLSPGTQLGPYEVLAPLGAGGMGEVYRARDARLGRDVAIKVLPDDVANDSKALARFESEARAVAALSHPNILALFDVGEASGIHYAVTELLDGETLRDALRQGAFPVRRALEVSQQIAEGLAAAHEKGIVHRDVKPENVFITKDGHAKLLDFGLARHNAISSDPGFTNSPTADAFTERGAVLGTVVYMSPEQASGRTIDHRSDQFSFGIVLYEMLAGTRPFRGNTVAETLTAIIREEPQPLEKAASGVPAPFRWIVERLLAKESGGRYDSTRDLARDLAALRLHLSEATSPGLSGTGVATSLVSRPRALARTAAAVGIVAIAVGTGVLLDRWALPGRRAAGFPKATFQRLTTFDGIETWPSLSSDGKTVAYQKSVGGKSDVYTLRVGGKNPTNLTAGLEGDHGEPAFSPDGRFIAFRSESGGGGIFLMEATGESVKQITDFGHTPAWFPDGTRIALATEAVANPSYTSTMSELWILDLGSGARRNVPGVRAYQPSVSPHGLRIAYWSLQPGGGGRRDIFTIGTGTASTESPTAVTDDAALDWSPFWSGDGRFLYFASDRGGTMNLWRVGIDEASGKVLGSPEPVTVPVSWAGPFRATPDGSRVVFTSVESERTLARVPFDAAAEKVLGASVPLARFGNRVGGVRVSPHGDLLTLVEFGSKEDILVLKTDGTTLRRLTDDGYHNRRSTFSPDGKKIVFFSDRTGTYDLWIINVDGSGLTPFTRSTTGNVKFATWSPDGKTIGAADMTGHPLLLPFPRSAEDSLPEPGPLPGKDFRFQPSSWSPDSKHLAGLVVQVDGSGNGIVVYDVEKKTYRRVTETGVAPSFLRDGRRIAFQDGNVLKIVDTANGRISEILKGDSGRTIDTFGLSPDDRSLFVSWASAQADLWLMELGGKK
jgi:eukaryotic-like serine/threonine-protein kinase